MGLEVGGGTEKEEEKEKSPLCESIGHQPLRGHCPKRFKEKISRFDGGDFCLMLFEFFEDDLKQLHLRGGWTGALIQKLLLNDVDVDRF